MVLEIAGGIILAIVGLWLFFVVVALLCSLLGD